MNPKFYTGTFDVLMFKVILGLFGAFNCLKMACYSKTGVPGENAEWHLEVWGSCKHVYGGTFDLLVLKVIWGFWSCSETDQYK